jgi:putative ABC transport system permease protein
VTMLTPRELLENIRMAANAVRTHVLRSLLTVLGVLVGVFSIIVVMTAIRVMQRTLETQMSQLGAHTFQLQRWPAIQVEGDPEVWEKYARRKRFYLADAKRLRDRATIARAVSVSSNLDVGEAQSRFGKTNPNIPLIGIWPEGFATRNWIVEQGRPLVGADEDTARHVCVIGADLSKKLFPRGSALEEFVKFRGVNFRVVGVLEPKGSIFGQSQDSFIAIPMATGVNRYGRETSLQIQVQATGEAAYNETMEQARGIVRAIRKVGPGEEDDFELVSNQSIVSQFRGLTEGIRIGSAVISSIALVAAGIGIMNIMLVSVTERTREIGIRRAIGAKKRSIMSQFISEAILLSQVGGVLGIVGGIAVGNLVALATKSTPLIPWDWVGIGFLVCSLVGVLFGTYPAWKAANLDPIDSLRYE